MNRRLVAGAAGLALSLPLLVATAGSAAAAPSAKGACVQAGLGTLKDLDLLRTAAAKGVDYDAFDSGNAGFINTDLPVGSYLSLGQVVKLHTSSPALFDWCG
jgi:hypothetical protein